MSNKNRFFLAIALLSLSIGAIVVVFSVRNEKVINETTITKKATTKSEVISYLDAKHFAGQTKTVEGKIAFLFNNGKSVLIGFQDPHQGYFKIQITKDNWQNFPNNFGSEIGRNKETIYHEGNTLRVKGFIDWYQGDPTIYVSNPDQIEII